MHFDLNLTSMNSIVESSGMLLQYKAIFSHENWFRLLSWSAMLLCIVILGEMDVCGKDTAQCSM